MSDGQFKLVFKPLDGTFELERQTPPAGGGLGGGAVTSGTLVLPNGVSFELTGGIATTGDGEISLAAGSTILVLP